MKKYTYIDKGKTQSKGASNIALIKYWGKYENQIPANSSVSYTLSKCVTNTTINWERKEKFSLDFSFEGKENPLFKTKIEKYLLSIEKYIPFIKQYAFTIESKNTFPHSSGIASSASAFSALALGLMKMEKELTQGKELDLQKASYLARLGSGSACRSIYKGLVVWGESKEIENSNNKFAIPYPYPIKKDLLAIKDAIALIHEGEKSISSTIGHSLMNSHPFAQQRFAQAQNNFIKLKDYIAQNNWFKLGELIEQEALSLHAMMLTSTPSYILMKPNTIASIKAIRMFRNDTNIPVFFTLDAGANVHILYPDATAVEVEKFILSTIKPLTANGNIIFDCVDY